MLSPVCQTISGCVNMLSHVCQTISGCGITEPAQSLDLRAKRDVSQFVEHFIGDHLDLVSLHRIFNFFLKKFLILLFSWLGSFFLFLYM